MALPINIEDLLNKQRIESNRIEFKKGWNPTKIYQTICAFANDFDNIGGGYILVGVEEEEGRAKRPVCGLSESELDKIQRSMVGYDNKINPYYRTRSSVEQVDGRYILAIWVPSGVERPYDVMEDVLKKDARPRWYIRQGSSTIEAKGETLVELREMANRVPFDDRPNPQIETSALSPLLIEDYLRRVGSRLSLRNNLEHILESLDLYAGVPEQRFLKNVAAMMFCERPDLFFPYTRVDIVIYPEGVERNPNNMIEIAPIVGSIPHIIRQTLEYLRVNVIKERILKVPIQEEAIKYFNYPYQALEEAVVNALYHRDYQQREPVEIRIEPHEISILSHSGPDRSITQEVLREAKLFKARRYRNRRLGDFLKELRLSEGRATGIPTIQQELHRNGSKLASIDTDEERSYFLITIPCHVDFISEPISDQINEPISDQINELMSERQKKLIAFLQTSSKHSYQLIAEELDCSPATAKREVYKLLALGLIERVGSNKYGYWRLRLASEKTEG